jgi:hypothetical protein
MGVMLGTVKAGKVVVEEGSLVEGSDVFVITPDESGAVHLEADELAELEAGIAEADRGETITEDELFRRLGRIRRP